METVEIWMWTIAGLIITSFILATAFSLVGKHIRSENILSCDRQFSKLYNTLQISCVGGEGSSQTENAIFPNIMETVYVKDSHNKLGRGNLICYKVRGEKTKCEKVEACNLTMEPLNFHFNNGLFSSLSRIFGRGDTYNVKFVISKINFTDIYINWTRTYLE